MIELKSIRKVFNPATVNENVAIPSLDLTIEQGEFVTVIGSNGAGKSTMLNLVAGYHMADSGEILINGVDMARVSDYKRSSFIGVVFQDPLSGTAGSLTIEENLAIAKKRGQKRWFSLGVSHADREYFRERLKDLGLGLENRLRDRVGLLSGGQRQALTLLMATLVRPEILLLDEHTAALDPKTAAKIVELTDYFVKEFGLTTLMVTHNMKQALAMGNRTIMMHNGEVVLDIKGTERENMSVQDLLEMFSSVRGEEIASDRMLLS